LCCGSRSVYTWSDEWVADGGDGEEEEMAECIGVPASKWSFNVIRETCNDVMILQRNSRPVIYVGHQMAKGSFSWTRIYFAAPSKSRRENLGEANFFSGWVEI